MIFGESAGALSVNCHLILTGSAGLFRAAVMESGFPIARPLQFSLNLGVQVAQRAGCTGTGIRACLRTKTTQQIRDAQGPYIGNYFTTPGFGPVLDGVAIKDSPYTLFAQGKWAQVPVLAGTNTDEGTMFVMNDYPTMDDNTYKQYVYNALNSKVNTPYPQSFMDQVYTKYPPSGNNNTQINQATASSLIGDYSFVCGTRHFLRQTAATATSAHMYLYRFNHLPCGGQNSQGIYHSCEIPFVYDCCCGFNTDDQVFNKQLGAWWTNMAVSGDPNQPKSGSFTWPTYDANGDHDVILINQFTVETGNRKSYCDFWDSVNYYV